MRYGLLDETKQQLDYVLALTTQDFLERRLQVCITAGHCSTAGLPSCPLAGQLQARALPSLSLSFLLPLALPLPVSNRPLPPLATSRPSSSSWAWPSRCTTPVS